jgi:hypothetical protein
MSLEYDIVCDGCGNVIDGSSVSAAVAREQIRREGGRAGLPGGRDLCPLCVRDGAA